jgi:hypothetical protein
MARSFEHEMTKIESLSYADQMELLIGFKKLLEKQLMVIDLRLHHIERL